MRVVSGKFQRGMKVKVARTGRTVALSRPQRMFAQDRSTVQEGFAGDVIGLSNPGAFAVGDTIYAGGWVGCWGVCVAGGTSRLYRAPTRPDCTHSHLHPLAPAPPPGPEVAFPPIPSFSPELFAYLRCAPNQRKAFAKGVEALLGEGAVQVRSHSVLEGVGLRSTPNRCAFVFGSCGMMQTPPPLTPRSCTPLTSTSRTPSSRRWGSCSLRSCSSG